MNKSSINNVKTELKPNSEQKPIVTTSSQTIANALLAAVDLEYWGFVKVGFGTWVHPDFRIAMWKPYWAINTWKVEMEGCTFNLETKEDLTNLVVLLRNGISVYNYAFKQFTHCR